MLFLSQNFRSTFLSLALPQYGSTLKSGTNLVISCCQLCSVDAGVTTRNGPQILCVSARYASTDILCTVFPRPISSASMPLMPCSYKLASQFNPFIWYSFKVQLSSFGWVRFMSPILLGFWKFISPSLSGSEASPLNSLARCCAARSAECALAAAVFWSTSSLCDSKSISLKSRLAAAKSTLSSPVFSGFAPASRDLSPISPSTSSVLIFLPMKCEYNSVWLMRKLSFLDCRRASLSSSSFLAFAMASCSARVRMFLSSRSCFFQKFSISLIDRLALVIRSFWDLVALPTHLRDSRAANIDVFFRFICLACTIW
ncbi:hypothetical protein OGATHE_004611 [Ogataea polymorpha]|uniref:Uncharacterized protein n=1 Tax=Ogataea polymorpha TaxID=460523 RepID=A0A9P8T2J8_9ASCO|nr:hypothetical protein OGATHE_004611 [Ogataea polymorpha]